MSIVSFTGEAKDLSKRERKLIESTVEGLKQPRAFFSGAAKGVDIYAAGMAIKHFPTSRHVVVVPYWIRPLKKVAVPCKHDEYGVERLRATAEKYDAWIEVYEGAQYAGHGDETTGLMRRNDILAQNCTHIVAFPAHAKEAMRSGTWATVRRARKLERARLIVPLDGSGRYRER